MNRILSALISLVVLLAVCGPFTQAQDGPSSAISDEPLDGTYSDAYTALLEAFWAQNQDDIITSLQIDYPDVFDLAISAEDIIQENPIPTGAALLAAHYGMSELLDLYGPEIGIDSIPVSIPLTQIYDGPIYPFVFPIQVSVGGVVEYTADNPASYYQSILLQY